MTTHSEATGAKRLRTLLGGRTEMTTTASTARFTADLVKVAVGGTVGVVQDTLIARVRRRNARMTPSRASVPSRRK